MRSTSRLYAPLIALALIGALLALSGPATSFAAAPSLTAFGTSTAPCGTGGRPVPAVQQGQAFQVRFNSFAPGAVPVTLTFPDGRIYTPPEAALLSGLNYVTPAIPFAVAVGGASDPLATFATLGTWPLGCYTVTAEAPGVPTPRRITTQVALLAPPFQLRPGATTLLVQDSLTGEASGPQGGTGVNIIGRNIPSGATVALILVQPDGSRIALPAPLPPPPPANHGFTAFYLFTPIQRTGTYTLLATITAPSGEVFTNRAQFTLTAQEQPPQGNATLRVLSPINRLAPQGDTVNLQGALFTPGPVALSLVLPGGAIVPFGTPIADAGGTINGVNIVTSPQWPTGTYTLIAVYPGLTGPASTRATWQVIP